MKKINLIMLLVFIAAFCLFGNVHYTYAAPAENTCTMIFDNNITKVQFDYINEYDEVHYEWTQSGMEVATSINSYDKEYYEFTVTLKEGYILKSVESMDPEFEVISIDKNTFKIAKTPADMGGTYNLISKEDVPGYTVTIDGNDADLNENTIWTDRIDITIDDISILNGIYHKDGYTIKGLSLTNNGNIIEFNSDGKYIISNNTTLYIIWERKVYQISIESDDLPEYIIFTYELTSVYLDKYNNSINKIGYIAIGFSLTENGEAITLPYEITKNITIYPVWQIKEYTITYFLDGGTNPINNSNTVSVANRGIPDAPYKKNFVFDAWYYDAQFKDKVEGQLKVQDITLYAKYIPEYQITFILNGGQWAYDVPYTAVKENTILSQSQLNTVIKKNSTFNGWYTDIDCTQKYDYQPVVSNITLYADYLYSLTYINYIIDGKDTINTIQDIDTINIESLTADKTKNRWTGWYLDPELKVKVEFPLKLTYNTTIYSYSYDDGNGDNRFALYDVDIYSYYKNKDGTYSFKKEYTKTFVFKYLRWELSAWSSIYNLSFNSIKDIIGKDMKLTFIDAENKKDVFPYEVYKVDLSELQIKEDGSAFFYEEYEFGKFYMPNGYWQLSYETDEKTDDHNLTTEDIDSNDISNEFINNAINTLFPSISNGSNTNNNSSFGYVIELIIKILSIPVIIISIYYLYKLISDIIKKLRK